MAYKVLYRKYRPDNFENLVGQEYTVEMLKNSIKNEKISHAYIFTGPRGTGKTSTAKIFAKAINCLNPQDGDPCNNCEHCKAFQDNPDIIEIDAASNNGVDEIRELINNVKLSPTSYKYKVYIIDEVHMLSTSAFNALLLTLEEPPSHVVFILATTDIQNVPITILSRCQRFDFKRIENSTIVRRLKYVCEQENIQAEPEALEEISVLSEGGLRDALGMLDQLATSISREIKLDDVISHFGTISTQAIEKLIRFIEGNDVESLLGKLNEFRNSSLDYKVIVFKLMKVLEHLAISVKTGKKMSCLSFAEIKEFIFELNDIIGEAKLNVDPYVLVEMVLLEHINSQNISTTPMETKVDRAKNSVEEEIEIPIAKPIEEMPKVENTARESDIKTEQVVENVEKKSQVKENKNKEKEQYRDVKVPIITESWIATRINNCFCDAQKSLLEDLKSRWNEFLDYIKEKDTSLYGIVIDTEPVVASIHGILLDSKLETNAALINEKMILFEELMHKFYEQQYPIIAVSHDKWMSEKKNYIDHLKAGKNYQLQQEEPLQYEEESSQNELESIANDVFLNNVEIEIE